MGAPSGERDGHSTLAWRVVTARVSTIAVRVEKFVPAYESPPNAVHAAKGPDGDTRAREGMPGTS